MRDPIVLVHAHALLASTYEGTVRYLQQDLRDADSVLAEASATLDFSQPVAVILVGILYLLTDEDGPHLVLSHLAAELMPEMVAQRLRATMQETFIPRSHADVSQFFDGLDMLEPPRACPPAPVALTGDRADPVRWLRDRLLRRRRPQTLTQPGRVLRVMARASPVR